MALDFSELTEQFARRLIYVVGSARGGSTFTNRVIGVHPSLLYVGWNDKTFSNIWPQIGSLSDEQLRLHLLHHPRGWSGKRWEDHLDAETLHRWHLHVEHVCHARSLRDIFCLRGIFYWLTQADAQPLSRVRGWCIKANTWEGVDELKRAIPEAQIVFVIRDPRSTALSFAKVYARRRQEHFADHDLVRGTMNWLRNATEFAVRLNRYDDAHLIHFEELVSEPVATLNSLYVELGLEPIAPAKLRDLLNLIEYSQTKTHEERGRPQSLSGVQAGALDRWRQQLSEDRLAWVCSVSRAGAHWYGYELDKSGIAALLQAMGKAKGTGALKCAALYLYCRTRLALLPSRTGA